MIVKESDIFPLEYPKEKAKVTKEVIFETAHRLLGYKGSCRNTHGHSYRLQATWEGEIDEFGFVEDFKNLKKALSNIVDWFDHKMLLNKEDPKVLSSNEEELFIFKGNPTAEHMVRFIKHYLNSSKVLENFSNKTVKCVEVKLWETATSFVSI
jgi:6-pyruvoyltetrahydropterin/6-carboxytetrahydropterin synthase